LPGARCGLTREVPLPAKSAGSLIHLTVPFPTVERTPHRALSLSIPFAGQPTDGSAGWRANVMIEAAFRLQLLSAMQ